MPRANEAHTYLWAVPATDPQEPCLLMQSLRNGLAGKASAESDFGRFSSELSEAARVEKNASLTPFKCAHG